MEYTLISVYEGVINGKKIEVENRVKEALEEGVPPEKILNKGLISAMGEVGRLFECGEFYIPEMLIAARAMQAGLTILKPHLVEQGVRMVGKVIIGTVKGDLHDIGKNLVAMMLEGAGFEIVDLGTNVSPEKFAESIQEHNPHLLGMSALLTTTMQNIEATIETIERMNLRNLVKIIVGGAPVTDDFASKIGADGYAPDASRAVTLAKSLIQKG